jgi:hypothetical protein
MAVKINLSLSYKHRGKMKPRPVISSKCMGMCIAALPDKSGPTDPPQVCDHSSSRRSGFSREDIIPDERYPADVPPPSRVKPLGRIA